MYRYLNEVITLCKKIVPAQVHLTSFPPLEVKASLFQRFDGTALMLYELYNQQAKNARK